MGTNSNDCVLTQEQVSDLLDEVVLNVGIKDAVYEISRGSLKGDGYTSFLTKVAVKGQDREMRVVIKCAPENPVMRNALPTRDMFLREIKFYKDIVPMFKKMQSENGVQKLFNSSPVCYTTRDLDLGERIVLEDLRIRDFTLFPKKQQMNDAHIEMVLDAYAQLHALSFGMEERDPASFAKLKDDMDYLITFKRMGAAIMDIVLDGAERIHNIFDEAKEPQVFDYFKNLKKDAFTFFESLDNYDGTNGVFIHGDSWCNNMMFKYSDESFTSPTDMRLLDFQVCSLMPPAIDLVYFFYVSTSAEMMDNFQHYQKLYHDKLVKYAAELDCDVNKRYPFATLQDDWKKYSKLGLYLSACIYRIRYQGDDEIVDFTEASPKDALMKSSRFDDVINEKYREIAMHFYKYKLL